MKSFIELRELGKNYATAAGSYPVLKNVNLNIAQGEFVALMGPSGSGKSTLMNILGCLDIPTSGNYFLDGIDIGLLNDDELAKLRNKTIGFIFQGFNLLPRATLVNNVALPLIYAGISRAERLVRATELLVKVGLGSRLHAMPNEISGGEQQRVAIARALTNKPKLILADEPTGNLDTTNSSAIMQLFLDLNREGITIFLVTHEPDIAAYARRLIKLRDGCIVEDVYSTKTGFQGAAQIDSSSLDFPRGVREASKRNVLGIHEHCEQARNKAENQNAKSILQESRKT